MTIEEQKGNDEKEGTVSQQNEMFCLAKLYGMKDADDWEEIYVGLCAISKVVSSCELALFCIELRPMGYSNYWN